jgi:DNA-binding NarL/FixJ family response regulator
MKFQELYPQPEAETRWTALARPLGEVALEKKIAPNPQEFQFGVSLLEATSRGVHPPGTLTNSGEHSPENIRRALIRVADIYGTHTIPQTVAALIENRVLPVDVSRHQDHSIPSLSWKMAQYAAQGLTNTEIARKLDTPQEHTARLWDATYASLGLPPTANPSMAVRRGYETGKFKLSDESPVVVFSAPERSGRNAIKITDTEQSVLDGYGGGLEQAAVIAEQGIGISRYRTAYKNVLAECEALHINEALVKSWLMQHEPETAVLSTVPLPVHAEHTRILVGLAFGYSLRQVARRLSITESTAKSRLQYGLFRALGVQKQGAAIQRAFETGLFVAGHHPDSADTQRSENR